MRVLIGYTHLMAKWVFFKFAIELKKNKKKQLVLRSHFVERPSDHWESDHRTQPIWELYAIKG